MKLKAMTLYKAKNDPVNKAYYRYIGIVAGENYLCLGEITNMPEHYAFVLENGKVVYGLHSDMFEEIED